MKNSKKLIIASLMLVFAFVAVVSSTFAWFTMQQQAEVEEITLNVATAGTDLQISTDGTEGSYGYSITLGEITGKLAPVTFDDSDDTFKGLAFDETDTFFVYENAVAVKPGATEANEGYLEYDLWFKSSEAIDVNLDLSESKSTILSGNTSALGSLRFMFIEVDDETHAEVDATRKIWEPTITGATGTFGTGAFYNPANNYIAYNAYTTFLEVYNSGVGHYELNDTYFTGRIYTPNTPVDDKFNVTTLAKNVAKHIRVRIWIEGWDGDCNNTAAEAELKTFLSFIGE
jgi:hypothetical protein